MAQMSVRSTYALDEQTAQRIRHLARVWGVSQAEVIRRSVEHAAAQQHEAAPSPAEVVAHYQHQPLPRTKAQTRRLIASLRAARHADDAHRAGKR